MKKLFSFCLLLISIIAFSQIIFEKSYFIDNNNQRTECLIKNVDWKYNPKSFTYKLSENAEEKTAAINDVKEFEIYNQSHYIRANVKIDSSSEEITQLSSEAEPQFVDEVLFLKKLNDGQAKLYRYTDAKYNTKYFYQMEDNNIEQLVYKMYYFNKNSADFTTSSFTYNEGYKNQLKTNLSCNAVNANDFNKLGYKQDQLLKLVNKYNECVDPNFVQKSESNRKKFININLRPRVNFNSLSILDYTLRDLLLDDVSKTGFGFGVEFEFILPINKDKWAIIFEPTYHYYKAENTADIEYYVDKRTTTIDYKTIQLPIGIRHYMFLNKSSKMFLNAQFVLSVDTSSSLKMVRPDYAVSKTYGVKSAPNFAFGVGYNFNNKFATEFRYFTDKNITNDDPSINSQYKSMSLIFSYNIL